MRGSIRRPCWRPSPRLRSCDGGRHEGRDALKGWIQTATIDNRAVFTPDNWREEDGRIVIDGLTHGDFKGSPIRFTLAFTLEGPAITALEIH